MRTRRKVFAFLVIFLLLILGISIWFYGDSQEISINGGFLGTVICTDGGFGFNLLSKLVDSEGNPIVDTEVIAFIDQETAQPSENNHNFPSFTKTDSEGNIKLTAFTGLAWGGIYQPDLEPPPMPSESYTPQMLYFWHKDVEAQWHQTKIKIKDDDIKKAKRGELYIHLDKIQVNDSEDI